MRFLPGLAVALLGALATAPIRGADGQEKEAAYVKVEIGGLYTPYRHLRYGHPAVGITVDKQIYWLDYSQYKGLHTAEGTQAVREQARRGDGPPGIPPGPGR
jgi:hypothetical protein